MDIPTRESRRVFLALREFSPVHTRMRSPSRSIQTGAAAALPPLAHAPIHDDAHAVLAGELALEILVELRIVARHDEDLADLHHLLPALLDPEWHVHFAEQREGRDQVLLGPQAIAQE